MNWTLPARRHGPLLSRFLGLGLYQDPPRQGEMVGIGGSGEESCGVKEGIGDLGRSRSEVFEGPGALTAHSSQIGSNPKRSEAPNPSNFTLHSK